jgi:hypothetical protein
LNGPEHEAADIGAAVPAASAAVIGVRSGGSRGERNGGGGGGGGRHVGEVAGRCCGVGAGIARASGLPSLTFETLNWAGAHESIGTALSLNGRD